MTVNYSLDLYLMVLHHNYRDLHRPSLKEKETITSIVLSAKDRDFVYFLAMDRSQSLFQ